MRITLLAGILFLASTTFAQDEEIKTKSAAPQCRDLAMVPDCSGYVYSDFRNIEGREVEIIFHAKSGKTFTGDCKVCYNNGMLKMHVNYANGYLIGKDTVYHENGTINLITSHDLLGYGKEDGVWKFYRPDGSLKWEKTYEMGMAQGEQRYYYPDSTLFKIEIYKNNQLHGKKQEYYRNQSLKKEIEYKHGQWDGKYITYFEDGKVESEQQYIRGRKDGPSAYYYKNGFLFYTENHENGSKEGTFKRMYGTGKMWTLENYKNNLRNGEFEEYYNNEKNTVKYEATYKKGVLVSEMYYDEFGGEVMSPERIEEIRKAKETEENGSIDQGEDKKKEGEKEDKKKRKGRKK